MEAEDSDVVLWEYGQDCHVGRTMKSGIRSGVSLSTGMIGNNIRVGEICSCSIWYEKTCQNLSRKVLMLTLIGAYMRHSLLITERSYVVVLRDLESLPSLHDKVLAAALEAAINSSQNQKKKYLLDLVLPTLSRMTLLLQLEKQEISF
ncbi:hypothetical protein Tco_0441491 [Tanacetum coccineum]